MGHAIVYTNSVIVGATGGTFADTFVASSGDSQTVANYQSGGARVFQAWGIDSDSIAETSWYYTRTDSTQDTTYGLRCMIPSAALGGAATNAAFNILNDGEVINVFPSDVPTIKATSTASDDLVLGYLTEYDNLPGSAGIYDSWQSVSGPRSVAVSFNCNAVASGTVGSYGASRAFNTDDTRWVALRYYAILGFSVKTQVTTIAMKTFESGNNIIAAPMGSLNLNQRTFFKQLSADRGKPLIPILNGSNVGNAFLYCIDGEASTSPKIDIHCLLLPADYTPPAPS